MPFGLHLVHDEGEPLAESPQRPEIALPAVSEPEIRAQHQLGHLELLHQDAAHELLRGDARELPGEMDDHQMVDRVSGDHFLLELRREDPLGSVVGAENAHRMWLERHGDRGRLKRPGPFFEKRERALVAEMDAVEVSERHRRPRASAQIDVWIIGDFHHSPSRPRQVTGSRILPERRPQG